MGQYGYNPGNAATFNQLVRTGLTEEEAATQSGVSTNASQYGFGTNSNAGSVIPGAGGIIDPNTGLAIVPYVQSGTGDPAQQPAQTNTPAAGSLTGYGFGTGVVPSVPNTSAATVELPPFQIPAIDDRIVISAAEATLPVGPPAIDDRIIISAADAASGFGYGTGINNPSVAPTTAAEATTSPYSAFSQVQTVPQPLQTPAAEPSPFSGDPAQRAQQRATEQAATIDANTSGIPIRNEEGQVVQGILQNPETGETYYTDPPVPPAPDRLQQEPTDVEQNDAEIARLNAAGASVGSINSVQDPQQAAAAAANAQAVVGTQLAQRQTVLDTQRRLVNNGDWRVRLSLAKNAQYLYNDPNNPGILKPLAATGGVIFPYLPKIDTTYTASYEESSLTHSNHKNYFYKSSSIGAIGLIATFTAQDSVEADYLLAVIHFFRSVTKMFYGQDAQRGAPPPLVYLTGLGAFQFSEHPCVVQSFNYSLPNDVDYIRARSPNVNGTSLLTRRSRQDLPTDPISGSIKRLSNLFTSQGVTKGAQQDPPAPPTLGKNSPTYVPTKMDITLSLLPVQTRSQVSQVFSLKSFANGDLIKGGFW